MRTSCRECGTPFPPNSRVNKTFCDMKCSREWTRKEWRRMNPKSALGKFACGTIEDINLMRVTLDLMAHGCQIFRAAFKGMSCDLLVYDEEIKKLSRVEVLSGSMSTSGTVTYPIKDMSKYDIAAVVMQDTILYFPPDVLY